MSKDIDIELAADNLKQLWEMHKKFMLQLRNHQKREENRVGSLRVDGDKLSITSLGIFLDVRYRPVIVDNIQLLEYIVFTVHDGEQIIVFKFYLKKNGTLIRDVQSQSKLTDFSNEDIKKNLVYEVAEQLLLSPIFKIKKTKKSDDASNPLSDENDSAQSERS